MFSVLHFQFFELFSSFRPDLVSASAEDWKGQKLKADFIKQMLNGVKFTPITSLRDDERFQLLLFLFCWTHVVSFRRSSVCAPPQFKSWHTNPHNLRLDSHSENPLWISELKANWHLFNLHLHWVKVHTPRAVCCGVFNLGMENSHTLLLITSSGPQMPEFAENPTTHAFMEVKATESEMIDFYSSELNFALVFSFYCELFSLEAQNRLQSVTSQSLASFLN